MNATSGKSAAAVLRRLYGERIPDSRNEALRIFDSSGEVPAAEKAALREQVLSSLGQRLERDEFSPGAAKATPSTACTADGLMRQVSAAEAKALFDRFAADPEVPHHFIDDGCHYRSLLCSKQLDEQGVYSERLYSVPDGCDLQLFSEKHPLGYSLQMHHCATAIYVTNDSGKADRWVIDPSLFGGPVPETTWLGKMRGLNGKPCKQVLLPRFTVHLTQADAAPTAWSEEDLAEAKDWCKNYREVQAYYETLYDDFKQLVADAESRWPNAHPVK
jgi:hypothetical protein